MKEYRGNPGFRKVQYEHVGEYWKSFENRQKASTRMKEPSRRDAVNKGIKAFWADEERCRETKAKLKNSWADPEVRERRLTSMKEARDRRKAATEGPTP